MLFVTFLAVFFLLKLRFPRSTPVSVIFIQYYYVLLSARDLPFTTNELCESYPKPYNTFRKRSDRESFREIRE